MKHTKIIGFLTMLLCMTATFSKAQTADTLSTPASVKARVIADRLEHEVNLTSEQKDKVYTILLDRSIQWGRVKNATSQVDKGRQMDEINSRALKGLSKVLTKEQFEKHTQLRKNLQEQKDEYYQNFDSREISDEDLEMDF